MWISVQQEPIPTYGMDRKQFRLFLQFQPYYGHCDLVTGEIVTGVWNSACECFFELETGLEIDDRDITHWYKEG